MSSLHHVFRVDCLGGLLLVLLQVVLVLGALEVCMVLFDGVEDHTTNAAGVTTAEPCALCGIQTAC